MNTKIANAQHSTSIAQFNHPAKQIHTHHIENCTQYQISARHATGLRLLLLIAGIELNPGQIDLTNLNINSLEKILLLIPEDDVDYRLPATKRKVREALGKEPESAVKLALKCIIKEGEPTSPPPANPANYTIRSVKLPDFYEKRYEGVV